ncbi:rab-GTPase-TBC domain-containing protein [Cokeromyces recurvatus]|uniref:rab-GTPase-TBC domain-containing protein n=1 Tax=Cokeromyces recurvatus TaxID=90255 RepID=UPI00221E7F7B|nr:rab-GTPase-TBC domain-containing protein [Cokeromyces recurvatus]KAI7897842.1 rab-GTPase-TBC domain-containing protein [Cokeromyces recurvatus]
MSLYEIYYVSSDSNSKEAHLKKQQNILKEAFEKLRIQAKQEQQEIYKKQSTYKQQMNYVNTDYHHLLLNTEKHSVPYCPFTDLSLSNSTITSKSSLRTPSLTTSSSSSVYMSDNSSHNSLQTIQVIPTTKSETSKLTERDNYGFKRPLQWVDSDVLYEFEQRYKITIQKQIKTWNRLLANNSHQWPVICPQLKRYARKGIPPKMRPKAWMHYSGAEEKMNKNPELYFNLLQKARDTSHCKDAIKKDIHRTFPDNYSFDTDALYRVLLAFSVHSPSIGYCQSLNFVAGFLLLVMEEEQQAFWILVTIVQDYFPEKIFDVTMEGGRIEQSTLMLMIYEKMPAVWAKLSHTSFWDCRDELPPITLLTTHWFLTLFVNILPVETVMRIWDCFFVGEGFKVLYQVTFTLLKLNEQRISKAEDSVETFQILQNMPKRMIDCDKFIKCIFSGDNDIASRLTVEEINSKRNIFKNRLSK